jgi:hypothetical protein
MQSIRRPAGCPEQEASNPAARSSRGTYFSHRSSHSYATLRASSGKLWSPSG